jgi:ribosome-associated protein
MPAPRFTIEQLLPWIEVRFGPASGPGGQNVNKVSTRATLLFDFEACERISEPDRRRIRARCASRLSADGRLRIAAQVDRTQVRNRNLAEERLLELLREVLHRDKSRKPTRPTKGSQERRLKQKRQQGERKRQRNRPDHGDY